MNTQDVANQLVSFCREGKHMQAIQDLYADAITSREMPGTPNEMISGKEAVTQKTVDFFSSVEEIHGNEVSDPMIAGNHFSCNMVLDATFKEGGRQRIEEVCVYEVNNGKIVNEQFFYSMPQ